MHAEAVNARVLHLTPVAEDAQLHEAVHRIAGVLREGNKRVQSKTDLCVCLKCVVFV